ncbi:hypothetical protein ACFRI7_20745 [Streptomyces sp. NPDC056716]|uniref:hypothetical protein n=1 Tax=unclassified Streptomyces TaxID=2593676 RepID=UPI003699A33D
MSDTTPPPTSPPPPVPPSGAGSGAGHQAPPPPPPSPPPAAHPKGADHRDLSRVVLFYALALAALLAGVGALLTGIAWLEMADTADNSRSFW